jgi:hypothetical protein
MTNALNLQSGQAVRGLYYGVSFSGVVESSRPHTMRNDAQIVHVVLDAPISALGLERDTIALTVDCLSGQDLEGAPCAVEAA